MKDIKVTFVVEVDGEISLYQSTAKVTKKKINELFIDQDLEWKKYVMAAFKGKGMNLFDSTGPIWVLYADSNNNVVPVGDYSEETESEKVAAEYTTALMDHLVGEMS